MADGVSPASPFCGAASWNVLSEAWATKEVQVRRRLASIFIWRSPWRSITHPSHCPGVHALPSFTAEALRRRLLVMADSSPEALVFQSRAGTPLTIGYVNEQNAARIAGRLDSGEAFVALFIRGAKLGTEGVPWVLACRAALMRKLGRPDAAGS